MTMQGKISIDRLREIIAEELASVSDEVISEQVDHSSIRDIVNVASKLLAAVEAFKKKAPAPAINAVTPGLSELEKTLENMVATPGSYVPQVKKEPKRVSLKAVKSSKD